jgi:hypothetical protein
VAPRPSPEDVQLNRSLAEAGRIMDVNVLDDLVIGHDEYVSLKDRRLGFQTGYSDGAVLLNFASGPDSRIPGQEPMVRDQWHARWTSSDSLTKWAIRANASLAYVSRNLTLHLWATCHRRKSKAVGQALLKL